MRPTDLPAAGERTRRARGNELVECALIFPALLALLLVVGEVAGAVATHQVLNNAAREGARLAVVPGEYGLTAEVQNRVIAYAAANGVTLAASNVTVDQNEVVNPGGGACGASNPCIQASRVAVSYSYPLSTLLGAAMQLGAAVEMRNFY
ncbi:MAG TPA: TadE/TadG family type IV pilus assembly protein [Terriglobales bacterium]|nr:TadE/TadG family type IV pilus assembly protein [Terriglobales bacterium]